MIRVSEASRTSETKVVPTSAAEEFALQLKDDNPIRKDINPRTMSRVFQSNLWPPKLCSLVHPMDPFSQVLILSIACVVTYLVLALKMNKKPSNGRTIASIETKPATSEILLDNRLILQLRKELPSDAVSLPSDETFSSRFNIYWAQQSREVLPGCIISPTTAEDVSTAIRLIKLEYDRQRRDGKPGNIFAIRSGGYSSSPVASGIAGGILLDLSRLDLVTIADDRETVDVGTGAKWSHVSRILDVENLAVSGGRNGQVGVGGLTLGGGISFFSPRFGFVCSNVVSYEVVLASGSVVTASAASHPRLWRALKGGLNNFGIVTKFTFRAIPSTHFWSGWIYTFHWQKSLRAFHEFAGRRDTFDPYAAGPILVSSYIYPLGLKIVTINLTYTKLPNKPKAWPQCFAKSGFSSLWRVYSTCKTQSLSSMSDEFAAGSPAGKRQLICTTTVRNCLETMQEARDIVTEVNSDLNRKSSKPWRWFFIYQPIFPGMMRNGQENCLSLSGEEETLINLQFTITWDDSSLDPLIGEASKIAIDHIETMAKRRQTYHPYKYANYCGAWQNPLASYGDDNLHFLRDVSKEVDPDQLFQHGCPGGFKLSSVVESGN